MKKWLLVAAVAAVAIVGLKYSRYASILRQEAASVVNWADEQIPVEKKIASLRSEVRALDKDLEKVKNDLAKEIVAAKELSTKTSELRAIVETEHKSLVARGDELKDATEKVKFGNVMLSVTEAKDRLKKDVQLHLTKKKSLEAYETALATRQRNVDTLQKSFEALKKQKEEMMAQIDAVEAEYKALQLQQIESKYQTDDSRLAKVKESLRQLKNKLDVERTKLELEPKKHTPSTPVSDQSVDDILAPLKKTETGESED